MNRAAFRRRLLAWYAVNKRGLPWRAVRDPYRIWLSEVMLQQTRVAAVVDYYRRFLRRFPTVRALARARSEEVLRHWAGLGYYSRARNLHRAAKDIVARHGGRFPRDYAAARALPGVGAYTAAAVTSIAYSAPHAVLDGNVARVLARLFVIRGDLRAPRRWARLQELAQELIPVGAARWVAPQNSSAVRQDNGVGPMGGKGATQRVAPTAPGEWNQAMMELGATVCTPRAPRCEACPVARWCGARARGLVNQIPATRRKRAPVEVNLDAAVVVDARGRTVLVREDNEYFSRMWQFPAARAGRDAEGRLAGVLRGIGFRAFATKSKDLTQREQRIAEGTEKGPKIHAALAATRFRIQNSRFKNGVFERLEEVQHRVTFREIRVVPFLARVEALPRARNGERIVPLRRLDGLPVSSLTRKIAAAALARLEQE